MVLVRVLALMVACVPLMGFGCYVVTFVDDADLPLVPGADPGLLLADGKFWAYTTTVGLIGTPVYSNTSLAPGNWVLEGNALGSVANWAGPPYWAPDVVQKGSTFYLFYTGFLTNALWDPTPGEHAIGVACASSPSGPFHDCSANYLGIDIPVYRDPDKNGVIDAEVVKHGSDYYLLWSLDWGPGGFGSAVTRKIQGCKLNASMTLCDGAVADILSATRTGWEKGVVENPTMIRGPEAHYLLFYSGGFYKDSYRTGAAWCGQNPLDACIKEDEPVLTDGTFAGVNNPGGLDVIPWLNNTALGVLHAAGDFTTGDPRRMHTASLDYVFLD